MKIPDVFVPEKDLEKKLNELMEPKQMREEKRDLKDEEDYSFAKEYGFIEIHTF